MAYRRQRSNSFSTTLHPKFSDLGHDTPGAIFHRQQYFIARAIKHSSVQDEQNIIIIIENIKHNLHLSSITRLGLSQMR
jgi:hypothetical protein